MTYSLAADGDDFERDLAARFADREFPEYELFWRKFVVPLTRRDDVPPNIGLRSDGEVAVRGETPEAVCISELHYSVLLHLGRAHKIKNTTPRDIDDLFEGVSHLAAALDIAEELLGRMANRNHHPVWTEQGGRSARADWRRSQGYPLQDFRDYRNRLVHGRLVPNFEIRHIDDTGRLLDVLFVFPKIGCEASYDDWRTLGGLPETVRQQDFAYCHEVLADAWAKVLGYVRLNWRSELLGLPA